MNLKNLFKKQGNSEILEKLDCIEKEIAKLRELTNKLMELSNIPQHIPSETDGGVESASKPNEGYQEELDLPLEDKLEPNTVEYEDNLTKPSTVTELDMLESEQFNVIADSATYRKPRLLTIFGQKFAISSWLGVLGLVTKALVANHPEISKDTLLDLKFGRIRAFHSVYNKVYSYKIMPGLYMHYNCSAEVARKTILMLFEYFQEDLSQLEIAVSKELKNINKTRKNSSNTSCTQ